MFYIQCSAATSAGLSAILMLTTLLGRAVFVFPLSALSNLLGRGSRTKISGRHQVNFDHIGLSLFGVQVQ